jgi:hypothetical protein
MMGGGRVVRRVESWVGVSLEVRLTTVSSFRFRSTKNVTLAGRSSNRDTVKLGGILEQDFV